MAKNASMFVKMATILSLFVMFVVLAESRSTLVDGLQKAKSVIVCSQVTGVEVGDDCTTISQSFKMSLGAFLAINPNINCEKIFVGQWVCVDGSATN
ncbi:Peptidoglycan-binding lysin domain-containing protein [Cynara cardunculus var. scolymus]|uniref:Peptidoglycan-binding lysin domain-containing protein n=1 Tax=Cynara cardunculus var. scolymus TaxID=59895 RepID=A0A103XU97_CYNCS|nr:Peptidoglycan-binding lysin domain-containing protein [Cynara cardunculus var. scolymus]